MQKENLLELLKNHRFLFSDEIHLSFHDIDWVVGYIPEFPSPTHAGGIVVRQMTFFETLRREIQLDLAILRDKKPHIKRYGIGIHSTESGYIRFAKATA